MEVIADPRDVREQLITGLRPLPPAPARADAESPPLLDTLAAAARGTVVGGAFERFIGNPDPEGQAVAGFDPFADLDGFEQYAGEFASADSPAAVRGIKARITQKQRDLETLDRAGWGGFAADVALNLVDPTFLVALAVPQVRLASAPRVGRAVTAALEGAAQGVAYETAQQNLQVLRTAEDSALAIGEMTLLSGILGGLSKRVPKAERDAVAAKLRADDAMPVNLDGSQSFGAAGLATTTLEQETLSRGGRIIAKLQRWIPFAETDLTKVLESQSVEARRVLQSLADVTPMLNRHWEGIASGPSVESLVTRYEGAVAELAVELDRLYAQHRKNPRPVMVGAKPLNRAQFYEAVTQAARRGDVDLFPDVAEGARFLRSRVFDPLKQAAEELGLLPKNVSAVGAASYVTRLYDREAIRRNRAQWDKILTDYFERQGMSRPEARSVTEQVTRQIMGQDAGLANFDAAFRVPNAGPLEARVLAIEDALIEPFLRSDPIEIARRYVSALAPQVEVTRVLGDKDLKEAIGRIRDEFDVMRERARATVDDSLNDRLAEITDDERRTLEALVRIRDRIYGRAGRLSPESGEGERLAAKVLRDWRNVVGSARMGGTALTGGISDLNRIVPQYGFAPTMQRLGQLLTRPTFRRMSLANHRRIGNATEVAMAKRLAVATDGGVTEGWSSKLAGGIYKMSGLNHVTDFWRTLAGTLIEDRILAAAADVATGKPLDKLTRARLARIGLDEDSLRGIAEQIAKHGETVEGLRMSNSLLWTDGALAERYESAIVREARITVQQPGAADRVWWADSELGKTLGQLKSFALGAPMRMTVEPAQLIGSGHYLRAAQMLGFFMVGGALSYHFRMLAAGKTPTDDPAALAGEAFSESGVAGILPDLVSPFARRFGVLGESARYSDRNVVSAFGGPAVGTFVDAYDVAFNRTQNGMSAKDLQALRRLLPGQNLWYLRRAINALEGETAEALGLEGADSATFLERMARSDSLLPAQQRGGTGTGLPAY